MNCKADDAEGVVGGKRKAEKPPPITPPNGTCIVGMNCKAEVDAAEGVVGGKRKAEKPPPTK
jgi:hypothetical protein